MHQFQNLKKQEETRQQEVVECLEVADSVILIWRQFLRVHAWQLAHYLRTQAVKERERFARVPEFVYEKIVDIEGLGHSLDDTYYTTELVRGTPWRY